MKKYTSLEQSKKLMLLLPIDTADMAYLYHISSDNPTPRYDDVPPMILADVLIDELTCEALPCWSVGALLDILPNDIKKKDYVAKDLIDDSHNRYDVHISKFQFYDNITMYQILYGNCFTFSGKWKEMVSSKQSEDLIECIIDILVWMKKNDFVNYYE